MIYNEGCSTNHKKKGGAKTVTNNGPTKTHRKNAVQDRVGTENPS